MLGYAAIASAAPSLIAAATAAAPPCDAASVALPADVDATQTLSFHEFVAAALVRRVELDDKMLHVAFEAIDSEGLGYITREAVVATMGRDAKRYGSTAEVDAALAHAGVGGRVDYNEFLDYIHEQRLSGIGSVSSEETKDERTGSTSPEIPSVIYKF